MIKIKIPALTIVLALLFAQAPTAGFGLEQKTKQVLGISGAVLSGISGCAGAGLAIHTYRKLSKIKQQLNKNGITQEEREAYEKQYAKIKKRYWIAGALGALGITSGIASGVTLYRNRNAVSNENQKPEPGSDNEEDEEEGEEGDIGDDGNDDDGDDDGNEDGDEEDGQKAHNAVTRREKQRLLVKAVRGRDHEAVKRLLADPRIDDTQNYYNSCTTPLHIAAKNHDDEIIKLLLKKQPSIGVNKQDLYGMTPLHKAVDYVSKDPQTIKLLLEDPSADPNILDGIMGWTPLFFATVETLKPLLADPRTNVNTREDASSSSDGRYGKTAILQEVEVLLLSYYPYLNTTTKPYSGSRRMRAEPLRRLAVLCGIHENALEEIDLEDLSCKNLERYFWNKKLLFSYELKTLEDARKAVRETASEGVVFDEEKFLTAAIRYKTKIEERMAEDESERFLFANKFNWNKNKVRIQPTVATDNFEPTELPKSFLIFGL